MINTQSPRCPAPVAIGPVAIAPPFGLAPMAGLTDSAFRRLVKRAGGCGIVVTEMVSSEGVIRGGSRAFEFAGFTDEERPVAVQVFGGDPDHMADAARALEARGADLIDVNMGCPVPKIARHEAGCSLMRDPVRAARIVAAMVRAVRLPVTVKMRAGWNHRELTAPELARRLADAGAAAIVVHGRTAEQGYSGTSDWDLIARVARESPVPVFGNGDLVEPDDLVHRVRESGVAGALVGRGAVRNPWLLAQAADLAAGRTMREVTAAERGRFLLDYIDLLLVERIRPEPRGGYRFHPARGGAIGHDRWVINKIKALMAWFSKGIEGGPRLRAEVNGAETLDGLRDTITRYFPASVRVS